MTILAFMDDISLPISLGTVTILILSITGYFIRELYMGWRDGRRARFKMYDDHLRACTEKSINAARVEQKVEFLTVNQQRIESKIDDMTDSLGSKMDTLTKHLLEQGNHR
jgi:hypothetical protein